MQLPLVSASLMMARAIRGLTIPEVAAMAGVEPDEVFDAENFLDEVQLIAMVLNVDMTNLARAYLCWSTCRPPFHMWTIFVITPETRKHRPK